MSEMIFFKVLSDSLFYLGVIMGCPTLFRVDGFLFIGGILISLGVFVSAKMMDRYKDHLKPLGFIFIVAGVASGFTSLGNVICLLPLAGYGVYQIVSGMDHIEINGEIRMGRVKIIVFASYLFVLAGLSLLNTVSGIRWDFTGACAYGFAAFICEVIALRGLRLGADYTTGKMLYQVGEMGAFTVAGAALAGVLYLLRNVFATVAIFIASRVLIALAYLTGKSVDVFNSIDSDSPSALGGWGKIKNMVFLRVKYKKTYTGEKHMGYWQKHWQHNGDLKFLVIIGIGLMLLAFIIYLVKSGVGFKRINIVFSGSKSKDLPEEASPEKKETGFFKRLNNRGRIRKVYKEFMVYLGKKGIVISPGLTSEEILDLLLSQMDMESAKEVRNIYLKARYSDLSEITSEEVNRAEKALKRIKNS